MSLASMSRSSVVSSAWLEHDDTMLGRSPKSQSGPRLTSLLGGLGGSEGQNTRQASKMAAGPAVYTPGAPTAATLQEAAADAYTGLTPTGMRPFTVDGRQLSLNNTSDGATARAWVTPQNKVVIAYEGTNMANPGSYLSDIGIGARTITPGEVDSAQFARSVVAQAKAQGYSSGDVFVTGHSLGGTEAEFVASRTGLGGASFDGTGIPVTLGQANGNNFTSYIQNGDPVSSYASDVWGEQPFAPSFVAGGGSLPHYGHLVAEGDPAAQTELARNVETFNIAGLLDDVVRYHLPGGTPGGMA